MYRLGTGSTTLVIWSLHDPPFVGILVLKKKTQSGDQIHHGVISNAFTIFPADMHHLQGHWF